MCLPPPHVTSQLCHAVQEDTEQCTPQYSAWHGRVAASAGHDLPPWPTDASLSRRRVWTPGPHDALHADHACHEPTLQSTGQGLIWQGSVYNRIGQARPPCTASSMMGRSRRDLPKPHVAEHAPHEPHEPSLQFTGQLCVLQTFSSISGGHAAPPNAFGVCTERLRRDRPLSHSAVHEDHAVHEVTAQGTAHGVVEHGRCSSCLPQVRPPCCAGAVIPRVRI